jgi:L-amino acid N-acyltransferase YncA
MDRNSGLKIVFRQIAKIVREEGARSLYARALRLLGRKIYHECELVYVERSLQNLTPRYGIKDKFTVDELFIADLQAGKFPMPSEGIAEAEDALREGCRIFILCDQGKLVGSMLVGKSYSIVNKRYQYPILAGEKELVNFSIVIVPAYRKGRAAGTLKERVMLKLKEEGYEKMLGAIDILNRSSLSLAFHFGFKEVKRVRLQRILFIRRRLERKTSSSSPIPLERPPSRVQIGP